MAKIKSQLIINVKTGELISQHNTLESAYAGLSKARKRANLPQDYSSGIILYSEGSE